MLLAVGPEDVVADDGVVAVVGGRDGDVGVGEHREEGIPVPVALLVLVGIDEGGAPAEVVDADHGIFAGAAEREVALAEDGDGRLPVEFRDGIDVHLEGDAFALRNLPVRGEVGPPGGVQLRNAQGEAALDEVDAGGGGDGLGAGLVGEGHVLLTLHESDRGDGHVFQGEVHGGAALIGRLQLDAVRTEVQAGVVVEIIRIVRRFLRDLQALQVGHQLEVVVAGGGLGEDALLGAAVGHDHGLVAGRGEIRFGDAHGLLVHLHGRAVLEEDGHDGRAPEVHLLRILAVVDGLGIVRDDEVVRVGIRDDRVVGSGEESALEHEVVVVGHQEGVDVVHEGDGLAVGLGDHGAVRRGGDRRDVGGTLAGVVHGHLHLGAVHLGAEVLPPGVAVGGDPVHVQGDAGVGAVVPAAPFPHVGAEDEILGVTVAAALFRVRDGENPVLVVGLSEGVVLEFEDEFLRHRNGEVLAEVRPPAGIVVFLADNGGGDFNRHGIVGDDVLGLLFRLVGGDLVGQVVRSVDGVGLEARATHRNHRREGRGDECLEHQISGFHNVVVG